VRAPLRHILVSKLADYTRQTQSTSAPQRKALGLAPGLFPFQGLRSQHFDRFDLV
jgi:hypothetical protein